MRRVWLVAVFALSLFFGTGAFAFGHGPSPEPSQATAQSLVTESFTAHTGADGMPDTTTALSDTAQSDTGPNDRLSDMPECLDVAIASARRGTAWHPPSPPLAQDLTPPVLDGPQRPPRGLPVSAA